jgi:4-hydroxybenzoate polyprenyltransferase
VLGAATPGEVARVVRSLDGRTTDPDPRAPDRPRPAAPPRPATRAGLRDHLELVRAPAVLTVLGDTVAGAAAAGLPLTGRRTLLPLASACLYAGGMALNDWASRDVDARERPERPIPSGRVTPGHALGVAAGLGAAGLALAAAGGGRRVLAVAAPLAAAVWLYDARLKDTAAGPVAMAACRGLDVLLGAGVGRLRAAAPAAAALAAHTAGVTVLSRGEVHGTTRGAAATVAAGTVAVAGAALAGLARGPRPGAAGPQPLGWNLVTAPPTGGRSPRGTEPPPGAAAAGVAGAAGTAGRVLAGLATAAAAAGYLATCLPAQVGAARTPTAPAARSATGVGIRAMIPLQAAWAARAGRPGAALALGGVAAAGALLRRGAGPRAVSET